MASFAGAAHGPGFQVGQVSGGAARDCGGSWGACAHWEGGDGFPAADSGVAHQETEAAANRGGASRPESPAEIGGSGGEEFESDCEVAVVRHRRGFEPVSGGV